MTFIRRLFRLTALSVPAAGAGWSYYTWNTHFVPFSVHDVDYQTAALRRVNPHSNTPICIDHAVRKVPLSQLRFNSIRSSDGIDNDVEELAKEFCRGIWCGPGYWYQHRHMTQKYRALPGRETHLWDRHDLGASDYPLGAVVTDHFEVVERSPGKITVRCGDSPLNPDPRPSDGVFSMEVTKENGMAVFHLKSIFLNSTPEGKGGGPMPWHVQWAHREYTKLWMETSVRRLIK